MTPPEQTELKPRPDPTALTDAAIAKLHDLMVVHLNSIRELTEEQFTHAKEMTDERIRSVQLQFQERDIRTRSNEDKLDGLETRIAQAEGRGAGVAVSWAVAVAVVGILMAFGGLFIALVRKG